ncbi:hypothetical protein F2Q69_00021550 [Brassica cretica]|uniref:Uncharacterized protein n=1 Tax=Brassica cretica TaxID=69181 RepID=A0A8S9QH87_BRACR|nr:hypothetical protein F2Q69_00021550 [Brassica cretica]
MANPSTIDKYVALGTEQSPRDADENEENASEKEEEKESSEKEEEKESSEVEEDNEGEKEVVEEEKEAGDEEREVREEENEHGEEEKEPKEGDEMEARRNDEEADERTTQSVREHETKSHAKEIEVPTIRAIGGGCNNAESGHAHAYSVEAPGGEALKALEGRLMNAISDGMKEVNKKGKVIIRPTKMVVIIRRRKMVVIIRRRKMVVILHRRKIKKEDKDGGSKDGSVLAIVNQVQSKHGNGDDDMDDTAEMSAATEQLESEMLEKAKTEKKKKEEGEKR